VSGFHQLHSLPPLVHSPSSFNDHLLHLIRSPLNSSSHTYSLSGLVLYLYLYDEVLLNVGENQLLGPSGLPEGGFPLKMVIRYRPHPASMKANPHLQYIGYRVVGLTRSSQWSWTKKN